MKRLAVGFGLAIWSIVFWSAAFSWMLVGASITLLLLLLGFHYRRVHVWVTAPIFKRVVQISLTRLQVHYHPEFDPSVRGVFAQNHINLLDGHVASWAIPHAFSGLMNAWQFNIPIYGWLMRMSKGIAVRKGRRDKVLEEISAAARERKEMGMSVLVFPEGHRTKDGRVGGFRRGVFAMARGADMPVVPIAVRGMYDVNRKGTTIFHPLRRVDVFVGPQIPVPPEDVEDIGAFADRVRDWIVRAIADGRMPERVAPIGSVTSAGPTRPT